jgi:hypothetical protein
MRQSETSKQQEAARAKRIEAAQRKDIGVLLDLPEFRRYLKRYLSICSVFKTTFTGTSETFFKEGQRSVGTTMFGEIMQVGPERFSALMAERMPEDEEEDAS